MALARTWTKTLYAASYKGVPFFVDVDDESGGRRIVEHQFPMRDDPFLEDLGEDIRRFAVTAYLASDRVDTDATALIATCAARGPGVLVLPTHGPLTVRCKAFSRKRQKDRAGYIAFELHFIREGAAFALATVASLANMIFVQADAMAAAAIASFVASMQVIDQPSFVAAAAIDGVQNSAAVLEAIRTSAPVDPVVSGLQRDAIQLIHDNAPDMAIVPQSGETSPIVDAPTQLMTVARAIAGATPAAEAMGVFEAVFNETIVVVPAPAIVTPSTLAEASNQGVINDNLRLMALTAYAESIARVELPDRPSALTLRANVAEYFEQELLTLTADDIALAHGVMALRDATIDYLSRAILDLAPVITVEANIVLPSLFWSYRLYEDPTRAMEIVDRNRLPHPSFIPFQFEALAR